MFPERQDLSSGFAGLVASISDGYNFVKIADPTGIDIGHEVIAVSITTD